MKFSEEALKYLNLGIQSEIAAYVFYRRASKKIADESLRTILDNLAMDEKHHFLVLEDEYDRVVRSEMWAPYKDIMVRDGLPEIDELVQDTHKQLLGTIGRLKTSREVLEMALSLEQEAFDLFHGASANTTEPEIKKVFDHLASFEQGHVKAIEKELAAR
jgi:rubrerythrin